MNGMIVKICGVLLLLTAFLVAPMVTVTAQEDISKFKLSVEYYDKAQEEFGKQQWNRGKAIVDEGLKRFPDDTNLNTLAGKYWLHNEKYEKARFHLVKAVNEYYNNVEAKQMLVTVEDITGNYSSAICYINELLEINPYWEGLWRKKIELYKKQGNTYEANRLFKRLQQIYPKNKEIKDAYYYELELEYEKSKKDSNLVAKGDALRELTKLNPKNVDYQLALINHYYNAHLTTRALDQASLALAENPGNIEILRKKVGILEETGQHELAIKRTEMFINNGYDTPAARRLYNELMMETARQGRERDPYTIYGKIFERERNNREALDYLLNTSITKRYDQDAIYYLKEAKRVYGENNKKIRYKEYDFYKMTGNERVANKLLEKLHQDFPEDYDITYIICNAKLMKAELLMNTGNYNEALLLLKEIEKENVDLELSNALMSKLFACYMQLGDYAEAAKVFVYVKPQLTKEDAVLKETLLLFGLDKKDEALQLFYTAIDGLGQSESDALLREKYIIGVEELAIPYAKELISAGDFDKASAVLQKLLAYDPDNYLGILYSINLSAQLGKDNDFDKYTALGLEHYPNDCLFTVKQAAIYDRNGNPEQSVALMSGKMAQFAGNEDFVKAYSASSGLLAIKQAKERKYADAIQMLDNALRINPKDKELLYTKGLVYEYDQKYDSAYHYQKNYEPSALERAEFVSKMKGFRYKSNKNHLDIEYLQSRFSEADVLTSVASIGYERLHKKNTYSARLNYSGRNGSLFWNNDVADDSEEGGTGYQFLLGYTRKFNHRWTGMANLGVGCSYFPKLIANLGATYYFNNDWYLDGSLGYRRLLGDKNLFSLSAMANKEISPFLLSLGGGLIHFNKQLFFNMQAKARYMPLEDKRTSITAAAGFGTAPELNIIDLYSVSSSFSHMNTFASLGGQYLLTPNLTLGVLGVWNTLYDQKMAPDGTIATQYRNLYNAYVQLYISF